MWNDGRGALGQADMWSCVLEGTIAFSAGNIPRGDANWWRYQVSVLDEFFMLSRPHGDAVFDAHWLQAATELGLNDSGLDTEECKEAVWTTWEGEPSIRNKNQQVNTARWFQFVDENF